MKQGGANKCASSSSTSTSQTNRSFLNLGFQDLLCLLLMCLKNTLQLYLVYLKGLGNDTDSNSTLTSNASIFLENIAEYKALKANDRESNTAPSINAAKKIRLSNSKLDPAFSVGNKTMPSCFSDKEGIKEEDPSELEVMSSHRSPTNEESVKPKSILNKIAAQSSVNKNANGARLPVNISLNGIRKVQAVPKECLMSSRKYASQPRGTRVAQNQLPIVYGINQSLDPMSVRARQAQNVKSSRSSSKKKSKSPEFKAFNRIKEDENMIKTLNNRYEEEKQSPANYQTDRDRTQPIIRERAEIQTMVRKGRNKKSRKRGHQTKKLLSFNF